MMVDAFAIRRLSHRYSWQLDYGLGLRKPIRVIDLLHLIHNNPTVSYAASRSSTNEDLSIAEYQLNRYSPRWAGAG